MLSLIDMKDCIQSKEISDDQFLNLHIVIESYFKRLLMIGLRNNGVQYKCASKVADRFHSQPSDLIKKVWKLIKIDIKDLEKDKNYTAINNCHLNFTSVYRNQRLHGVIPKIENKELLELLIKVDKAYIQMIENNLRKLKNASCFNSPKEWGIKKKGTISNIDEAMKKFFDKESKTKMMSRDEVKKIIEKLKL